MMSNNKKTREDLIDALVKLSELRPEWRLGQTLANLATVAGRLDAGGVWDLEDDEALSAAMTLIEQDTMSETAVAQPGQDSGSSGN